MFDSSKAVPLRGRILCVLLADTVTWYGVLTLLSKKGEALCANLPVTLCVWIRLKRVLLPPATLREAEGGVWGFTQI